MLLAKTLGSTERHPFWDIFEVSVGLSPLPVRFIDWDNVYSSEASIHTSMTRSIVM